MSAKVIQGWFLGGQPKLTGLIQPKMMAPPPIQAKTATRPPGPPAPAFAARLAPPIQSKTAMRPPGPPTPAFAGRTATVQRHGAGGPFQVDPRRLGLVNNGGKPLPDAVRGKMEAALGANFANVRVHVGPQAERVGAIAFTTGNDIYFAPGRYQPNTLQGQQLLGHELAHVVQQRAGRVRNPLGSLAVVQDHALEAEADRMGQRAAAFRVADQWRRAPATAQPSAPASISPTISLRPHPVESTMFHAGRATAIQARLTFTSDRGARWSPDRADCELCNTPMSRGHRHHWRACGRSVCDVCAAQTFSVTAPLTRRGTGRGSSIERVCVDCILRRKIELARAASAGFRDLIAAAGTIRVFGKERQADPRVKWQQGAHPHWSGKEIVLDPSYRRKDAFADYVFELTNAATPEDRRVQEKNYGSKEEYGEAMETLEWAGLERRDIVSSDIVSKQKDFNIDWDKRGPSFEVHLKNMKEKHTKYYYDQWDTWKKSQQG